MRALTLLYIAFSAVSAVADPAPVLDGDRLVDAFHLPEPTTSFDEESSGSQMSAPLVFSIDGNTLRPHLSATGVGRVGFVNGTLLKGTPQTATMPPPLPYSAPAEAEHSLYSQPVAPQSSCLLIIKGPPRWKEGSFVFTVDSAYWQMRRSSPSAAVHTSEGSSRLYCGLFELVDADSTLELKCLFSECGMTVGGLRQALRDVQLDIKAADPDTDRKLASDEDDLPEKIEFEKAPYKPNSKKLAAAKAKAVAAAAAAATAKKAKPSVNPDEAAAVVPGAEPKASSARLPSAR